MLSVLEVSSEIVKIAAVTIDFGDGNMKVKINIENV